MRIANRHGIPLSPISTGKNNGYGGPSPRLTGAIVVDMGKRMNRILEVNEKYGYALLEPGVTYFDLYEHLQEPRLRPHARHARPRMGQRGRQHARPRRRLHARTATTSCGRRASRWSCRTGEVMRTGMGALPGINAWQLFPYGFGPYPDGMFTQSNLGIVTKMGIALMQRPPASMTYLITFDKEE